MGIKAQFSADGEAFEGTLKTWENKVLATGRDFDESGQLTKKGALLLGEQDAANITKALEGQTGTIIEIKETKFSEKPSPPFITSTLQQEANRKLKWSAKRTMSIAQQLYENGWITYMRTDSSSLSEQAIKAARTLIVAEFGQPNLPKVPRVYVTKSKGAQEAHEAIRPAGESFQTAITGLPTVGQ